MLEENRINELRQAMFLVVEKTEGSTPEPCSEPSEEGPRDGATSHAETDADAARGSLLKPEAEYKDRENTVADSVYSSCRCLENFTSKVLNPDNVSPTIQLLLEVLTYAVLLLLVWGASYTLFTKEAAPGSGGFALGSLFVLAYLSGQTVALVKLPPLLGMLIVGIAMRYLGLFNVEGVYRDVVSALRSISMVVILIKAGLGLDAGALRRLSLVVLRLAFIPCLVEATIVTVVSHFLLNLPWLWGLLLGFVLGAVSPAVVVPSLLALKEQGYGEDKGIATLVIAASSVDDIIAISGFGVVLGIVFSEGDMIMQIFQGPLEVVLGLLFGIIWGVICVFIPHKADHFIVPLRSAMVGLGGVFAVFGSVLAGYSGAGALAAIVSAFTACYGWKKLGWSASVNPVEAVFSRTWLIFQPVLFGLIGTEIDISAIDGHAVAYAISVLFIGLTCRIVASFLVIFGGNMNLKEMFFVAIAWFPKATVQAALGPVALDMATKKKADDDVVDRAALVLTVAVLSILITAPLGAVGIYLAGPRLLGKVDVPEENRTGGDATEAEEA